MSKDNILKELGILKQVNDRLDKEIASNTVNLVNSAYMRSSYPEMTNIKVKGQVTH